MNNISFDVWVEKKGSLCNTLHYIYFNLCKIKKRLKRESNHCRWTNNNGMNMLPYVGKMSSDWHLRWKVSSSLSNKIKNSILKGQNKKTKALKNTFKMTQKHNKIQQHSWMIEYEVQYLVPGSQIKTSSHNTDRTCKNCLLFFVFFTVNPLENGKTLN